MAYEDRGVRGRSGREAGGRLEGLAELVDAGRPGQTVRGAVDPALTTLNEQLAELRELNEQVLALADELAKGTIDKLMASSEAVSELLIECLSCPIRVDLAEVRSKRQPPHSFERTSLQRCV